MTWQDDDKNVLVRSLEGTKQGKPSRQQLRRKAILENRKRLRAARSLAKRRGV